MQLLVMFKKNPFGLINTPFFVQLDFSLPHEPQRFKTNVLNQRCFYPQTNEMKTSIIMYPAVDIVVCKAF